MKIVEMIPQLSSGGAERFTVDLCNELVALNHEVYLVVFHPLEKTGFYANDISNRVHIVVMNKKAGIDLMLPFRLFSFIKQIKPQIVHTHLRAILYNSLTAIFNRKIKCFHTIHNEAKREAGAGIDRIIRKFAFRHNLITPVTISSDSQNSFIDFYKRSAVMIVNGRNLPNDFQVGERLLVEMQSYKKTDRTRILVQLARMEEQKRHLVMARVVRRLVDEGFDFSVLMIGRKKDEYVSRIEQLKCPNIYMLGEKHNPLEYLHEADAFCLSSSFEGMPISLIEALGMGAVPICTPVGGIVNTIQDGVNGFLSKDIEEESYYQAMKRFLLLDDEQLAKMKQAVRESYKPYSMTECGGKYEKLFKKVIYE